MGTYIWLQKSTGDRTEKTWQYLRREDLGGLLRDEHISAVRCGHQVLAVLIKASIQNRGGDS